jgi:hypothetical protein
LTFEPDSQLQKPGDRVFQGVHHFTQSAFRFVFVRRPVRFWRIQASEILGLIRGIDFSGFVVIFWLVSMRFAWFALLWTAGI